jgi:phage/plasmid-associated DNA primase
MSDAPKPAPAATPLPPFVYVIPWERFVFMHRDRWALNAPLSKEGIIEYLIAENVPVDIARELITKQKNYLRAHGLDMLPGRPFLANEGAKLYVNTWVAPTRSPRPGPHPTVDAVLGWLTGHEAEGVRWVTNWMAAKVQNPELLPKTSIVFSGQQGAGKNTFSLIMATMLGPENCAEITRKSLENRFNTRWAGSKLFVFADEVMTRDNLKDISNDLKVLITSRDVEVEGKGKDQYATKNRLALAMGSNDDVTPVWIESGDRRYSVFSNHDLITDEYRETLARAFHKNEPTEAFLQEVEGFWAELLAMSVDYEFIARPFANKDRAALIAASAPPHKTFLSQVDEIGFDAVVESLKVGFFLPEAWDGEENGVSKEAVYAAYKAFCEAVGGKPLGRVRFGNAVRNHRPSWPSDESGNYWKILRSKKPVQPQDKVVNISRK